MDEVFSKFQAAYLDVKAHKQVFLAAADSDSFFHFLPKAERITGYSALSRSPGYGSFYFARSVADIHTPKNTGDHRKEGPRRANGHGFGIQRHPGGCSYILVKFQLASLVPDPVRAQICAIQTQKWQVPHSRKQASVGRQRPMPSTHAHAQNRYPALQEGKTFSHPGAPTEPHPCSTPLRNPGRYKNVLPSSVR